MIVFIPFFCICATHCYVNTSSLSVFKLPGGPPLAMMTFMVIVIIQMKSRAEKRLELSQAIVSLIDSIRIQKGCRSCDFCQSLQNENNLCLIEKWETMDDFRIHLKSDLFKVARGAMNLLEEPCEGMFFTVFHSEKIVDLID